MTAQYSARQVAHAFLSFCDEHGDLLTNLKLQKLLYYAQGWFLGMYSRPLFSEPLEAWIHGPVVAQVYRDFKLSGSGPISLKQYQNHYRNFYRNFSLVAGAPTASEEPLELKWHPPELVEHVKDVWQAYGNLTAFGLERLSHRELPWQNARKGLAPDEPSENYLNQDDMMSFFKEQAKNGNQEAEN